MNQPTDIDHTDDEGDAYMAGHEACSRRPHHFPTNPYPDEDDPCRAAWFEGADDAGRMRVYTNGIYTGEGV